jgi:HEAT repeat protein
MKKIQSLLIALLIALILPVLSANAQGTDARRRTTTTIIADGLAQLPAKDVTVFNTVMNEIASTGATGVQSLANMLVPATEGQNATVEYALSGLAAYVTDKSHAGLRKNVREGLKASLATCTDKTNKAFLLSLLQQCGTAEDAPVFVSCLKDDYLKDFAMRALIGVDGTDDVLLKLVSEGENRTALAYAVEKKQLAAAEPFLLLWLNDADASQKAAINSALAAIGTKASLPVLAKAAKEVGYAGEATNAYESYMNLLKRLAADPATSKLAVKQAKSLWKNKNVAANVHGAAFETLVKALGKDALPYLYKDLKNPDIEVRNAALLNICPLADDAVSAEIAKQAEKAGPYAVTDVLNWFGARKQTSEESWVASHVVGEQTDVVRQAAIYAAGIIGGEESLSALVSMLGTRFNDDATASLTRFNGKADDALCATLQGGAEVQAAVLPLIGKRRIAAAKEKVFELLGSDNADVSNAAYAALSGVVRPEDFTRLADLAEKAKGDKRTVLQNAMKSALAAVPAAEQYKSVSERLSKTADKTLYYPLLAQVGTREAIDALMDGYKNGNADAAFAALLKVNNSNVVDRLFEIADKKPGTYGLRTDAALDRALPLINAANFTSIRKFRYFSDAIALNPSSSVRNKFIEALGNVPMPSALDLAAKYLDNAESNVAAATAVKTIVAKSAEPMGGDEVKAALVKAQDVFRSKMASDPDAGYAVDEIKGMIEKLPAAGTSLISELTPEEKKEGFVMLFDGTNMDNWQGNLDNYTLIDGTIYVDAAYGSGGNLYTKKKYSDFIYRFEFQFMVLGVNNGVGIRTPMDVDAAYEGMEIQILDHDAPYYRDLREYQQHGSVYGIIPAKRVKFPELGTWNTEEIRAVGDHITVTVNGEVILDGNIREACKGHNVSADGGANEYTVDHQNHPGLFNKDGYISFCGHGTGIKFRNIRIKDLSKGKGKRR